MKKRISIFWYGHVFPLNSGTGMVVYQLSKYLHKVCGADVTLVSVANGKQQAEEKYNEICSRYVELSLPGRLNFWRLTSAIFSRMRMLSVIGALTARGLRKNFLQECGRSDFFVINFSAFFALLPRAILKERALVVTHDIMFYRIASFVGQETWLKRLWIGLNKMIEVAVLKKFRYVGVLADYEKMLLVEAGVSAEKIVVLGLPMDPPPLVPSSGPKKYDFLMVASSLRQNEMGVKMFFEKVAPLLTGRNVTMAVAGSVCKTKVWNELLIPPNFSVNRLGYVDDLDAVFAESKIGIGVLPCGSGVKVKVVESAMRGLPMILSDHGAEGIPLTEEGCINIDRLSPDEVRKRILEWLGNPVKAVEDGALQARKIRTLFSPTVALRDFGKCVYGTRENGSL